MNTMMEDFLLMLAAIRDPARTAKWMDLKGQGRLLVNDFASDGAVLVLDPEQMFLTTPEEKEDIRLVVLMNRATYDAAMKQMNMTQANLVQCQEELVAFFCWRWSLTKQGIL